MGFLKFTRMLIWAMMHSFDHCQIDKSIFDIFLIKDVFKLILDIF